MILRSAAHEIPNLEASLSRSVVTRKVTTIDNSSFDAQSETKKGGLNEDTDPDTVPQVLRALALPTFLDELVLLKGSRTRES